jgi:hypothetical protein
MELSKYLFKFIKKIIKLSSFKILNKKKETFSDEHIFIQHKLFYFIIYLIFETEKEKEEKRRKIKSIFKNFFSFLNGISS